MTDLGFEAYLDPFLGGPGINAHGDVAGGLLDAQGEIHAVLRRADGTLTHLVTLGGRQAAANDLNDLDQVVGWSSTGGNFSSHAFLWTARIGMQDLGTLPGTHNSFASAINDLGQVVGFSDERAFIWTAEGGMRDLGTLGGSFSEAVDINDLGQVVGSSTTPDGAQHVFLWAPSTGMHDLGALSVGGSEALGLNNLGHVVGRTYTESGVHAFLWTPESGLVDLHPSSGCSTTWSDAFAINDFDQVVGRLAGQVKGIIGCEAFVWTAEGGLVDLGGLGGSFPEARAINNFGQVVGASDNSTNTQYLATLWTVQFTAPTPVEEIQRVASELQNIIAAGVLTDAQADGLRAELEAATRQLNKDNETATVNLLQAFINQVQGYINAGIVSGAAGQTLIDAAQSAINQLMA